MIWWFSVPEIYPIFGFFSGFFRIFLRFYDLTIFLVIMDSLLLKFTVIIWFSGFLPFFWIFFRPSDFYNFHLSFFTSQILYDYFPEFFWNFFKSSIFYPIFKNIYDISLKYVMISFFSWNHFLDNFSVFSKYDQNLILIFLMIFVEF